MSARAAIFSLVALAAALLAAAPCVSAAPDPYDIFARSRAYWLRQQFPMHLEYDVAVDVLEGGTNKVEHYASAYDAVDDVVTVDPVSDYQRAHPPKVSGINLGILGFALNKPLPPADFLGVPHLAPNYSFGMAPFVPAPTPTPFNSAALVDEIREEFHDPNPRVSASPTPSINDPLHEIATVVAHNRDYTIALLGTDTIDGHACWHLGLTPTHDPGKFRIRQAWIDETTYAPWQLQDALNFVNGPGTNVGWTIHFTDVAGAHFISEEDALAPMSSHGLIFTKAAVRFENIRAEDGGSVSAAIAENPGLELTEPR
jgi:hypothetical protein